MVPTRAQVKMRAFALLNDPNAQTYTAALFTEAFSEACDVLYNAALNAQIPRLRSIVNYTLPLNTTSLDPSTAGIADFADYEEIEERLSGSTDRFTALDARDQLTQRDPADRLLEFVYRGDTFYFIGATTARELRITYEASGTAPISDGSSVGWDGSLPFLSLYAASRMAPIKGETELAQLYMARAVGARFDQGVIGGELFRLLQPRVRSMQHVQIAPKPFTVSRRTGFRRVPYIAAQQPTGGGTAPAQFSYNAGTITGTLDGTNATFYLSYPVSTAVVVLNGFTLTPTQHYMFGANQIVFVAPYVPQPGADILVEGWL